LRKKEDLGGGCRGFGVTDRGERFQHRGSLSIERFKVRGEGREPDDIESALKIAMVSSRIV
jgi:hypothetical protein